MSVFQSKLSEQYPPAQRTQFLPDQVVSPRPSVCACSSAFRTPALHTKGEPPVLRLPNRETCCDEISKWRRSMSVGRVLSNRDGVRLKGKAPAPRRIFQHVQTPISVSMLQVAGWRKQLRKSEMKTNLDRVDRASLRRRRSYVRPVRGPGSPIFMHSVTPFVRVACRHHRRLENGKGRPSKRSVTADEWSGQFQFSFGLFPCHFRKGEIQWQTDTRKPGFPAARK